MNHPFPELATTAGRSTRRVAASGGLPASLLRLSCLAAALWATVPVAGAQELTVTPAQRSTAQQVAQAGVPLSELAPNAPASYTVKTGDTLWAIANLFLRSPWRWPELWGMNLSDIRNPHRIYPGQVLTLDTRSGRALLTLQGAAEDEVPTVRVSPRTRYESVTDAAIPPISMQAIEPFLAEAMIVDDAEFSRAPRVVAAQEGRVLLSRGDRAYARSTGGVGTEGSLSTASGQPRLFRVFHNATPLKDPGTGEVLGYEAHYVGRVRLVRGEAVREGVSKSGKPEMEVVPATIDIVATKEEIHAGDRLIPEPERDFNSFVPRLPESPQEGQIVSVYGNAVKYAVQNQVVVINRGSDQGVENGHVLMVMKDGDRLVDRTDGERTNIRLPSERNGLMVVFRAYNRLSYALVLDITNGVKVGDRFMTP